jgi:hypothetical protein
VMDRRRNKSKGEKSLRNVFPGNESRIDTQPKYDTRNETTFLSSHDNKIFVIQVMLRHLLYFTTSGTLGEKSLHYRLQIHDSLVVQDVVRV